MSSTEGGSSPSPRITGDDPPSPTALLFGAGRRQVKEPNAKPAPSKAGDKKNKAVSSVKVLTKWKGHVAPKVMQTAATAAPDSPRIREAERQRKLKEAAAKLARKKAAEARKARAQAAGEAAADDPASRSE